MPKKISASRAVIRPSDLLALGLLALSLLLIGLLVRNSSPGEEARVLLRGEEILRVPLSEDAVVEIPSLPGVTLRTQDGGICVSSSDCPDQTCVRSGVIRRGGEYIVCLPNRLQITILTESSDAQHSPESPDGITR